MKILNLYAGLGGNRKKWEGHDVTAVEYSKEVASVYKDLYPNDNVICGDAHQYLLDHYSEFDFIWGSPPCPSHSRIRAMASKKGDYPAIFPDMKLYEEIIFLNHFFKGMYVIENVIPYYEPLIPPKKIVARHCFWANFDIGNFDSEPLDIKYNQVHDLERMHGIELSKYNLPNKLKALRNCVNPDVGLYILDCALGIYGRKKTMQSSLFDL